MTAVVPAPHWLVVFGACALAAFSWPAHGQSTAADMVRIAGGEFSMGASDGLPDERPVHKVTVRTFYLDRMPVTNAEFAAYLTQFGKTELGDGRRLFDLKDSDARIKKVGDRFVPFPDQGNHPVVESSWFGARAYCAWKGKRLPTEAEWEFAARGTEGRKYPWGNAAPTPNHARYDSGWGETLPVGTLTSGATPEGLLGMAGNVHQWTSSKAKPYPYSSDDGREDPEELTDRVTRGGAADTDATTLRATWRGASVSRNPRSGHHNIGFRCARDAPG